MHDRGGPVDSPVGRLISVAPVTDRMTDRMTDRRPEVLSAGTTAPTGVEGPSPAGEAVRVELAEGRTVLWFLTSSCRPCRAVWPTLRPGDVAVTPGPSTESRRKVAALAPEGVPVLMSSDVWFAFRPGPAPWRVVVIDGVVAESGSGQTGP